VGRRELNGARRRLRAEDGQPFRNPVREGLPTTQQVTCRIGLPLQEELNKRKFGLTPRQLEVASAVVRHRMPNKDIAQFLKISEDTVKHHITDVFNKLGVSTRLELDHFAREHKLPVKDLF
jgi:DNA-binding CsgD family transcriptional regulator